MRTKKRIILVSNTSWYLYNFRKGVIKFLLHKGYEVVCIAPSDSYSSLLAGLGVEFRSIDIDSKGTNVFKDLVFFHTLKKLYREYNPVLIFHYTIKPNIYGAFAAGWLGIPSISVVSGAGIVFLKKNLLFKFVKTLYGIASTRASELWFVNQDDRNIFVQEKIIPAFKTNVLPGEGIDTQRFKREREYSALREPFTFLFSARLLWVKGIEYYVNSARRIKKEFENVTFLVIGFFDKESQNAVSESVVASWEQEGVIKYLGELTDVKPLLETVHCLVFPSYYREGVPRVLLEAASMEIPIITTDNVGCRDVVVDDYNGCICKPKNEDEVYKSMKRILSMKQAELEQMGRNGRTLILNQFDENYVLNFYQESLQKYASS